MRWRVTPNLSAIASIVIPSWCRARASVRRTRAPSPSSVCLLSVTSWTSSGGGAASTISVYDSPSERCCWISAILRLIRPRRSRLTSRTRSRSRSACSNGSSAITPRKIAASSGIDNPYCSNAYCRNGYCATIRARWTNRRSMDTRDHAVQQIQGQMTVVQRRFK